MRESKRVGTTFGDAVAVTTYDQSSNIYLDLHVNEGKYSRMEFVVLTPRQARKIAKRLKRAARRART